MDLRHIDLIADPVIIGIDHRIISGCLDFFTECVDNIRKLRRSQIVHLLCFYVEDDRIGDRVVFDKVQDKICVGFRHRSCCRVGVEINADPETSSGRPAHVCLKIWVYRVVVAGSDHRELDIISGDCRPVDILLPLGNIDAPRQDPGKHGPITSNIGAGRVLLPGRRPGRKRRTHSGKSHDGT